ncbi:MAG: helix-turn-helix domain-containing protein [Alicyclobacillaceae bacterium]|nr:helix-turn-helix domain-containing protein [Alicyclobacillaceae bacterium]
MVQNRVVGGGTWEKKKHEIGKGSLGQKIRQARQARGLTQQALADGIVTVSMVSQIESDRAMPSYKVLRALAERLEMPLEHFLTDLARQTRQNALYKVARGKIEAGLFDQAVPILQELLEEEDLYVPRWKVKMDLAECRSRQGEWECAETILEEVVDDLDGKGELRATVQCLDRLAQVRLHLRRLSLAIYHWEKACELMGGDVHLFGSLFAEVHYHLGIGYARAGRLEEASKAMAKAFSAVQSDPVETAKITLHLAEVLHVLGDDRKACQYAERAMNLFEHMRQRKLYLDIKALYAWYYGSSGKIRDSMGMLRECAEEYRASGQWDEWVRTCLRMALLQYRDGRREEAEGMCRETLNSAPRRSEDEAQLRSLYGRILAEKGDLDGAVAQMETAVDLWRARGDMEQLSDTYADLVELYRKRGDFVRAEAALRNGLTTIRNHRRLLLEMG